MKMNYQRLHKRIIKIVKKAPVLKQAAFFLFKNIPVLPKVLTIALTYECQCQCQHCGVSGYKKKDESVLSTAEVLRLIEEARKIRSIIRITFSGGEALLRKDILQLVTHAKKAGFYIKIDSNAFLLQEGMVARLKEAGADLIGISIDHIDPVEHDRLRRSQGLFEKAIKAVQYCQASGLDCDLQTYATKARLKDKSLEEIIALSESLNVERCTVQVPSLAGNLKACEEQRLEDSDFRKLDQLAREHPSLCVESDVYPPLKYKDFCKVGLRTNVHITAYGAVQPCCWLPVSFGNVRQLPLERILSFMYRNRTFKKILSCEGCLCSNPHLLDKCLKRGEELPVHYASISEWEGGTGKKVDSLYKEC